MAWVVRYFVEDDGSMPVAEFEDSLPTVLGAKLARWVEAAGDAGFALGGGMFEVCHGYPDLFEIRAKVGKQLAREFCTVDGGSLVLLSGVLKKVGEPTPRPAFEDASRRLSRYKVSKRTA